MAIRKAVITAAGQGSRMRYITNVIPKALLPLFASEGETRVMRSIIDISMASLKGAGVEEFCFIVGKSKKALADHLIGEKVSYLVQKQPKGFGDAVLVSQEFSQGEPILIHTEDIVLTKGYDTLVKVFEKKDANAVFFIRKVENPKKYGVVTVGRAEKLEGHDVYKITSAAEKPEEPQSNLAIVGVYIFSSKIYVALKSSYQEKHELTYGIDTLIKAAGGVYGIMMKDEERLNVGDPESYFKALEYTFKNSK